MKKHSCQIEIRFSDIDAMGHVNNAVYLSYFEQARIALFTEVAGAQWDWDTFGVVLGRNEVDYLQPVVLNDKLTVHTSVEHLGSKSLVVAYELYVERGGGESFLVATGKSVLVCFDYKLKKTIPIPELWRAALS